MTLQKFSDKNSKSIYKNRLKSSIFFPLAGMLIMFAITVASPVFEILKLSDPSRNHFYYGPVLFENVKYIIFGSVGPIDEYVPDTAILMYMTVIIAAILCSIMAFKDLSTKKTANIYYSLGLSRTKLFTSTYLAGATAVISMTVIPLTVSFIVNAFSFGISKELLSATVFTISTLCNVSLIAYTLAAIAIILSGMFFEGAFFAFFINGVSAIFAFCVCMFSEGLLTGGGFAYHSYYENIFINSIYSAFLGETSFLNSLAHSVTEIDKSGYCLHTTINYEYTSAETWQAPQIIPLVVWTIILVGLVFLCNYLFNKKKVENIGFFATCKPLYRIFSGTMITAISSLAAVKSRVFTKGIIWLYILVLLAGAILIWVIANLILGKLSKIKLKEEIKFLPVYSAVVILFATIFSTGFFGYANRIPDLQKIENVKINAFIGDYYGYYHDSLYDENSTAINIGVFPSGKFYLIDEKEDIADIQELHKDLIKADKSKISDNYSNTKIGAVIKIEYTLNDGKTFSRTYRSITPQIIDKMLTCNGIEENIKKDMVNNLDNVIKSIKIQQTNEGDYVSDKYTTVFSNDLTSAKNVELTAEQLNGLLEAYNKDIEKLSVKELYQPTGKSLGLFTIRSDYDVIHSYDEVTGEAIILGRASKINYSRLPQSFSEFGSEIFIHITEKMTNTIQWSKDTGIYKYFEIDKKASVISVEATYNNSSFIKLSVSNNRNLNMLFNGKSFDDEYIKTYFYETPFDKSLAGSQAVHNLTKNEIEYIRKNAYPAYLTTTTGYFIKLTTDSDNRLYVDLFIPDSKLTDELKAKFESTVQ